MLLIQVRLLGHGVMGRGEDRGSGGQRGIEQCRRHHRHPNRADAGWDKGGGTGQKWVDLGMFERTRVRSESKKNVLKINVQVSGLGQLE